MNIDDYDEFRDADSRFFTKIDASGVCWEWTDKPMKQTGYGVFNLGQRRGTKLAHRFAYELLIGPIPDQTQLDHRCRNRICVYPDHLEPVTQHVNLLRGYGVVGNNARKRRCPKGHRYDWQYLRRDGRQDRRCSTCQKPYGNFILIAEETDSDPI